MKRKDLEYLLNCRKIKHNKWMSDAKLQSMLNESTSQVVNRLCGNYMCM